MLLRWLLQFLAWLGLVERPRFLARYSDIHPNVGDLSKVDLVIVGSPKQLKWACFRCPCGCGQKIALSLAPGRRPCWAVSVDRLRRPTLHPSVRQTANCLSHFWIRKGEVAWCPDTGRPLL